ncbi:hypothetical protein [Priestia sp. D3YE.R1]|uniref:hypothetical protein n=1 Tax=Priestia sp. D3YE.R1 TaxID=3400416 RepID=UPI003BA35398
MNFLIRDIIYSSIKNLFINQPEIFENTIHTNLTEWNLSYHLANEISKYLLWLDVDLDVSKRNYQNRRPDIIFHKRRTNILNFLVIELKKSKYDNQSDIVKIKNDWMNEPLNYRFGAYINIWGLNKYKAMLFDHTSVTIEVGDNCSYINEPDISNIITSKLKKLAEEMKIKENVDTFDKVKQCNFIDINIINLFKNPPKF